jgi:hypothetical protein
VLLVNRVQLLNSSSITLGSIKFITMEGSISRKLSLMEVGVILRGITMGISEWQDNDNKVTVRLISTK